MKRQIQVQAKRREEPDLRLFAVALIALTRQLIEEEEQAALKQRPESRPHAEVAE